MQAPGEQVEAIELDLLCEGIFRRYGYDFRQYSRTSLLRRVKAFMHEEGLSCIGELQQQVLRNKTMLCKLLGALSVSVTQFFRDPEVFSALQNQVLPRLETYPCLRIWHAGCASGEEAYSLAILLDEMGLLARSQIYATDLNEQAIHTASSGVYPLSVLEEGSLSYLKSGGQGHFAHYYTTDGKNGVMLKRLRRRIVFSRHNLVSDGSFNEFHLIFCRNVLIYFDTDLKAKVLGLLHQSQCRFGYLVLGYRELLDFSPAAQHYEILEPGNEAHSIFRNQG